MRAPRSGREDRAARSEFIYDSASTTGNLIETRNWDSTKAASLPSHGANADTSILDSSNSISTQASYNVHGQLIETVDANGNVTNITYGNVAGPNGNVTDLYPTQTVAAYGTSIARTSSNVYDFYTGAVTTATDVDNGLSTVTEYDALGRPTKVRSAANTVLESWTRTEYDDADRFVVVRSDLETKGDGKKVATQFYDQLGRVRLSKTLEDAATQSATNETDGIKAQIRYSSTGTLCPWDDATGPSEICTAQLVSNPFRADHSYDAGSADAMGWTVTRVQNNRVRSDVETYEGPALPTPFVTSSANTNTSGTVTTKIDANATTVTDQAGKLRRSITNGLGQLIRVDEPDGSSSTGALGTVASPNQSTSYAYDTLNNLTTVTQGVQTRSFAYSSLSRLTTATNPESGTISYGYDLNGNLTSKTDARSITTSYSYDYLNRVTNRNYSGGSITTPNVTYSYGTASPAVGKLTKVDSSVSTTEYTSFDILGRVTGAKQTTDGGDENGYVTAYSYYLNGALNEETYPWGRVVKNVLDANGQLEIAESRKCLDATPLTNATCTNTGGFWHYADSISYNAAGAVISIQLGNGRWESTGFNSRLQPEHINLGSTQGATDLLKLDYTYGSTDNNGNVRTQTITVPGTNGFTAVQTYSYDSLNRLDDSNEVIGSTTTWRQDFVYDRYGNRNFNHTNTSMPNSFANPAISDPTISTSNNQITSTGYLFDASGNTTRDASDRKFTYDAENKQTKVEGLSSGTNTVVGDPIGEYSYDGDGRRVKKKVGNEVTIFLYDAAGKQIAEYSTTVINSTDAKVNYLTNDHLGSPRINTDRDGQVIARHDYHPFGEEISASLRLADSEYAGDAVTKRFTGYERDRETDLDFAQARYFNGGFGRYSTPDNFLNDTSIADPAGWNLYVYVRNNPLNHIDPLGEQIYVGDIKSNEDRDKLLKKLNSTYGCSSCVTIDDNGNLTVDTSALTDNVRNATAFLTDAINSTTKFVQVLVDNNNANILFGQSNPVGGSVPMVGPSGEPITNGSGRAMRRNAIVITLDFADEQNVVGGSEADTSSFLDFVFAHEVSHFFPSPKFDPTVRGIRGDVDNPINEIRAAQGRPLRAEYLYTHYGTMNLQGFGDAARDSNGGLKRGADGIEVENRRVIIWLDRQKPRK